ncbi:MAG TPA: hypothetical protein VG963_05465 [Polyangiaceae bacterium]|nr:hypothetical protein [Polyangiaceae bacterium]
MLFTADGYFVEGQQGLDVSSHLDSILSCKADLLLPAMENGLPAPPATTEEQKAFISTAVGVAIDRIRDMLRRPL